MTIALNATHKIGLRSWVDSANLPGSDFPIQNLPFAVFRPVGSEDSFRAGVAIGDQILDLREVNRRHLLADAPASALDHCSEGTLNRFMSSGPRIASEFRAALSRALRSDAGGARELRKALVPQTEAEFKVPADIGDYTDFYTSLHHATAVGALFRPDNPLLPNYKWVPIAYHGRSSSIGVSGQSFRRPVGQTAPGSERKPNFGPSRRLDFELEVGVFIGAGNLPDTPIAIENAEDHVFGLCLLNDWSARDLQGWEYQPLGPFLSKNFASTISPWIITLEALAPFRLPFSRAESDPEPLPYLDSAATRSHGMMDVQLEVSLQTARMRALGFAPHALATSNMRHAYWSIGQMVAHHSVNGCNLRAGDLLGSGTLSGPQSHQAGSLLELTAGGKRELQLPSAETRLFLEDGDCVQLRGWCESKDGRRIGFGVASGTVMPAREL